MQLFIVAVLSPTVSTIELNRRKDAVVELYFTTLSPGHPYAFSQYKNAKRGPGDEVVYYKHCLQVFSVRMFTTGQDD